MSDELDIKPMEPAGFETIPHDPVVIPKAEKIDVPDETPTISDSVSIINIILLWIKEGFITSIIQQKGGIMTNDSKTTLTGVITALAALAAAFGFHVPAEVVTGIIAIGVAVLGYFTNKTDSAATTTAAK